MKNAIILHGQPSAAEYYDPNMPSMSNAHWIPRLQAQLLKKGIAAATPEVPRAYEPVYDLWRREVERFDITRETLVVGHSRGGDFWLKWLSEHPDQRISRLVLVAPGLGYLTTHDNYFGYYEIDPTLAERTDGFSIFGSINDADIIKNSIAEIRRKVPGVRYTEFELGHFTSQSMASLEFPELLTVLMAV